MTSTISKTLSQLCEECLSVFINAQRHITDQTPDCFIFFFLIEESYMYFASFRLMIGKSCFHMGKEICNSDMIFALQLSFCISP